ncbi:hypothetical protein ST43_00520 [Prevotella pectinovora]|nr:hypothetical protein ST43_00520 [Prevotella pectinovora]
MLIPTKFPLSPKATLLKIKIQASPNDRFELKMPTVEGRWANLMFSQRNNPYCDLLEIMMQI